jgi:hypothetical protein
MLVQAARIATVFALAVGSATAVPPTRVDFEVDETFPSDFLSVVCGTDVFVHVQGTGTTSLYYDRNGNLQREFDRLSAGFTSTIFAPDTGKSFSEVLHNTSTFLYPDGTEVGDTAIVITNGVQRTSGPGDPRIVGHQVLEGVIIGYTAELVPIVDPVLLVQASGQFDLEAVIAARCDALTGP